MDAQSKKTDDTTVDQTELSGDAPSHHPSTAAAPKQKKKQGRKIAIFALVLLLAAIAWYFLFILRPAMQKSGDGTASAPTHFDSLGSLLGKATAGIQGDPIQSVSMNGLGGMTADGFFAYSLPAYRADGAAFKTQPVEGLGLSYKGDSITATADYKKFSQFFTTNHFNHTLSQDGDSGYISMDDTVIFDAYDIYESGDTICSVWHADASPTKLATHVASIGCAKKDSYKKAADALKPFFTAYTKAGNTGNADDLIFGDPTSGNGTDGYRNAAVFQVDAAKTSDEGRNFFSGLYYQAPNSDAWTYVASANGTPDCSVFATDVLKKAFFGTRCYDAPSKTTISVQ